MHMIIELSIEGSNGNCGRRSPLGVIIPTAVAHFLRAIDNYGTSTANAVRRRNPLSVREPEPRDRRIKRHGNEGISCQSGKSGKSYVYINVFTHSLKYNLLLHSTVLTGYEPGDVLKPKNTPSNKNLAPSNKTFSSTKTSSTRKSNH